ncbi:MAG: enoyl-CoA hydratase/isomerase family protein [Firmicutes bacterium]|nr:enoyl-CoA hydratase/isomerase family protein [Bacillota bacterium]
MSGLVHFKLERQDAVARVTIDRPRSMNTMTKEVWEEMDVLLRELEGDFETRCVVLTGAGKNFSAGIDLSVLGQVDSGFIARNLSWLQGLNNRWENLNQPVIAAVNGVCFGAGVELILACDVRIAASDASFSIPEVQFGLSPDMGGSQRLARLVGIGQAKRLILGCERIDAGEALRIGLVEEVVEPDQLLVRAEGLARRIAGMPPMSVKFAKKAVNLADQSSLYAGLLYEQAQSVFCCGTEDKNEAVAAFFEKRKPVFKGK